MADEDPPAIIDLLETRSINSNNRRVASSSPQRESRAFKRARISEELSSLEPDQTASLADVGTESSSLSSIPTLKSISFDQYKDGQFEAVMGIASTEAFFRPQAKLRKARAKLSKEQNDEDEYLLGEDEHGNDNLEDEVKPRKAAKRATSASKSKAAPRKAAARAYHVNNQGDKPEPYGQPEIWADKRQQLCETVPFYRTYQGSIYQNGGIVYGQMIDKEVSVRDKLCEEVIITTTGGGRTLDEDGKFTRKADAPKRKAEPFQYNMKQNLPIGLIAGHGHPGSPSKLPHAYNVLDSFHVTDVWSEKIAGKIVWKSRMEKINLTKKSWWAVKGSPMPGDYASRLVKTPSQTCTDCGKISKVQFNAGWACLESSCKSFFVFAEEVDDATLDYSNEFMNERTKYQGSTPAPLSRALPTNEFRVEFDAYGYEWLFKRGIVCPKCGCCSRRIALGYWDCENPDCDFTHAIEKRVMSVEDSMTQAAVNFEYDKKSASNSKTLWDEMDVEKVSGGIIRSHRVYGLWNVNDYSIPDETGQTIGFVRHFRSNDIINRQLDGPNDMFAQVQSKEFDLLRRNPARSSGAIGEVLTTHFATNYGAPYKFGVKQESMSFDEAPDVILNTIKRLTWAGQLSVGNDLESFGKWEPFNECLAVGYFQGSAMDFHDDGEKTLGPTVATLSLGAPARMQFRPKANNSIGKSTAEVTGEPKLGLKKTSKPRHKSVALQFTLEHGDIVIMHGAKIQQLYEHAVAPWGVRYALTCRYIRAEMMDNEQEIEDVVEQSQLPLRASKYTYDGDMNAKEVIHSMTEVDNLVNIVTARLKTGDLSASQISEFKEKLAFLLASDLESGNTTGENRRAIVLQDVD